LSAEKTEGFRGGGRIGGKKASGTKKEIQNIKVKKKQKYGGGKK